MHKESNLIPDKRESTTEEEQQHHGNQAREAGHVVRGRRCAIARIVDISVCGSWQGGGDEFVRSLRCVDGKRGGLATAG